MVILKVEGLIKYIQAHACLLLQPLLYNLVQKSIMLCRKELIKMQRFVQNSPQNQLHGFPSANPFKQFKLLRFPFYYTLLKGRKLKQRTLSL